MGTRLACVVMSFCWMCVSLQAQESAPRPAFRVLEDIEYAHEGDQRLLLDLYLPDVQDGAPLVVWIHGGAWRSGSKANMPLTWLVEKGYAVASIDYRLSPVARFPAQVHDCKAAIRLLARNRRNTATTPEGSRSQGRRPVDIWQH